MTYRTLPLTNPDLQAASHDEDTKTYCFKVVCRHGMSEAGESRWAPWTLLFTTRFLSSLTFVALLVLSSVNEQAIGAQVWLKSAFPTSVVFLHSGNTSMSIYFLVGSCLGLLERSFHPRDLIRLSPFLAYVLEVIVLQS